MLDKLLASVDAQRVPSAWNQKTMVVVVENEEDGPGRSIADAYYHSGGFPLTYAVEANPGIAAARNKCLKVAMERGAEWIAFIDDDEWPEPDWLARLLEAQARYQADVVAGPVISVYEQSPPKWLEKGRFHDPPRRSTGEVPAWCGTGNVLFRAAITQGAGLLFDEELGLTGGSDVLFFWRIARAGHKIIWCQEAVAYEHVPRSRMTLRWILQRSFRQGNSVTNVERKLDGSLRVWLRRLPTGVGHLALNVPLLPIALFAGTEFGVARLRKIAVGLGQLSSIAGYNYWEYRSRAMDQEVRALTGFDHTQTAGSRDLITHANDEAK